MQQNRHRDPAQKTSVGKFDGKYLKAISKNCFTGDLRNFLRKISTFF